MKVRERRMGRRRIVNATVVLRDKILAHGRSSFPLPAIAAEARESFPLAAIRSHVGSLTERILKVSPI